MKSIVGYHLVKVAPSSKPHATKQHYGSAIARKSFIPFDAGFEL